MKYRLQVETTPEETRALLDLVRKFLPILSATAEDDAESLMDRAPTEPESEPESEPEPETAESPERDFWTPPSDFYHVVEPRQDDTPSAYGKPLEFKVAQARTAEEKEAAWKSFSAFMAAWCSPFSSDQNAEEVTYPDRAKIIEGIAGTVREGRIKQYIALHGSVNRAVYEWLCNYPWDGSNFSAADRTSDLEVLADSISGTIAQLASILMPELMVLYDISTSWRKNIREENNNG